MIEFKIVFHTGIREEDLSLFNQNITYYIEQDCMRKMWIDDHLEYFIDGVPLEQYQFAVDFIEKTSVHLVRRIDRCNNGKWSKHIVGLQ